MLIKELVKLGLSEKEAKVYLAALELGPSPVQKISQKARVNRATTYVVIEDLKKMGLMTTFDEGKKTFFVAEQPERLLSHLKTKEIEVKEKIKILEERMPELKSIFNAVADKPKVKYYEGIEGLKAVQQDFYESLNPGDVIYTFMPYDHFSKIRPLLNMNTQLKKRVSKKISFKIIYTSEKGRQREYERNVEGDNSEYIFMKNDIFDIRGGMNIYGNKIFMIDYLGRAGGVIIENKTLANLMRSIFLMTWNSHKKHVC